jgi:hypothetical protein
MTSVPIIDESEDFLRRRAAELTQPREDECLCCYVSRLLVEFPCDGSARHALHYRDVVAPELPRLGRLQRVPDASRALTGYAGRPGGMTGVNTTTAVSMFTVPAAVATVVRANAGMPGGSGGIANGTANSRVLGLVGTSVTVTTLFAATDTVTKPAGVGVACPTVQVSLPTGQVSAAAGTANATADPAASATAVDMTLNMMRIRAASRAASGAVASP